MTQPDHTTPPVEAAEGGQVTRDCKSCGGFKPDQSAACSFCGAAPSPAPASGGAVTAEMRRAGADAYTDYVAFETIGDKMERVFCAMIAASPQPVAGEPVAWPDIGTDPMKGPRDQYRGQPALDRLKAAYVQQQPGVPDQTALVWRADLGFARSELIRLYALAAARAQPAEERALRIAMQEAIDFIAHLKPEKARFKLEQALAAARPQHDEVAK